MLTNPPFPPKGKPDPSTFVTRFVDRGFEALKDGGILVAVVSESVVSGDTVRPQREQSLSLPAHVPNPL